MMMGLKYVLIQSENGGFRAPFFYGVGSYPASGPNGPRREPTGLEWPNRGWRGQLAEPKQNHEKHSGGARGGQTAPARKLPMV